MIRSLIILALLVVLACVCVGGFIYLARLTLKDERYKNLLWAYLLFVCFISAVIALCATAFYFA